MCTVLYEYAEGFSWKESTLIFDNYEDYVQWYNTCVYGNPNMHILLSQINKG